MAGTIFKCFYIGKWKKSCGYWNCFVFFKKLLDDFVLLNPERGFYHVLALATSVDFPPSLSIPDITDMIQNNQNISIVLVEIFLDRFLTSDISTNILDKLSNVVFPAVRSLSMKSLVRFAYTDGIFSVQDAAEPQLLRHIEQLTPILQVLITFL